VSDAYRVQLRTVGNGPTALGSAGPFTLVADRPVAGGGGGLGFNGGQLLYLSVAACLSNDLYREAETLGIARVIIDDYLAGNVDRVYISYSEFVSTATQRPVVRQLLPIEPPASEGTSSAFTDYIFEPSPQEVLARLLPRYIEMQIYEAVLQNAASFQSAQMVAMKNATDNANDITRELTLTYNKTRQEQITKELLDIVGGAAALED